MDIPIWLEAFLVSIQSPFIVGIIITLFFTILPGPLNVIIVEQSLEKGWFAGVGIALANCFGAIVALLIAALPFLWGYEGLNLLIKANAKLLSTLLAFALLALGLYMIKTPAARKTQRPQPPKNGYAFWAFIYTSLLPGNILANMGVVTALQASGALMQKHHMLSMMAGYFAGTACGWFIYIALAGKLRPLVSAAMMPQLKAAMGFLIALFAVVALALLFTS